ncbi:MAG: hypothetical protein HQL07_15865 [Nitrospirae bacterium]|nr:hypothetical protein [Magnetococcales bacterium]
MGNNSKPIAISEAIREKLILLWRKYLDQIPVDDSAFRRKYGGITLLSYLESLASKEHIPTKSLLLVGNSASYAQHVGSIFDNLLKEDPKTESICVSTFFSRSIYEWYNPTVFDGYGKYGYFTNSIWEKYKENNRRLIELKNERRIKFRRFIYEKSNIANNQESADDGEITKSIVSVDKDLKPILYKGRTFKNVPIPSGWVTHKIMGDKDLFKSANIPEIIRESERCLIAKWDGSGDEVPSPPPGWQFIHEHFEMYYSPDVNDSVVDETGIYCARSSELRSILSEFSDLFLFSSNNKKEGDRYAGIALYEDERQQIGGTLLLPQKDIIEKIEYLKRIWEKVKSSTPVPQS